MISAVSTLPPRVLTRAAGNRRSRSVVDEDGPIQLIETRKQGGQRMASQLRPLGDRIVVRPEAKEEVTRSGIVLPDTAKEKPQEGTIIAIGTGRVLDNGQ